MDIDRVKRILDPSGRGPPRRAVYTTHVLDRTEAPTERELDAVSELCHALFDTEPREPRALLRRCFEGRLTAWKALEDDVRLGYAMPLEAADALRMLEYLGGSMVTPAIASSCGMLIPKTPADWWASGSWVDIFPKIPRESYDDFKAVARHVGAPVEMVARVLKNRPDAAALFASMRPGDLALACDDPEVASALAAHAEKHPEDYGALAILGIVDKADADLGLAVLARVPRSKIDLRTVAAAALALQRSPDRRIKNTGMILEALCARVRTPCPSS